MSPKKEENQLWFESWFDKKEYELVYRHRNEVEAEQVVALVERLANPQPNSRILDVGCGRGRHALLFARRGYEVVGVDLSSKSIADARDKAENDGLDVTFEVADMRLPQCTACFDGVVNLFTAFGYFTEHNDHSAAIAAISQALRPDGWFLQDFLNADYVADNLVPTDRRVQDDIVIEQHRTIENGRINKRIVITKGNEQQVFNESVRLFNISDLEQLHRGAGLMVERIVGSYAGQAFTSSSPRLIMMSRKTASASASE